MNTEAIMHAAVRRGAQVILCLFTTQKEAKNGVEQIRDVLVAEEIRFKLYINALRFELDNGSKIICSTATDRIRGLQLDVAFVDENVDPEFYNSVVAPALLK